MNMDPVMYSYLLRIKIHDLNTYFHCCRVAAISTFIGKNVDLTSTELNCLSISAYLHDIGKILMPKSIINNPGKLNNREWQQMKMHPALGANLVNQAFEREITNGINSHHERWDGGGYPNKLKGENIPIVGRIIAVADAFDAMTSHRSYRSRMESNAAINEIIKHQEFQFEPERSRGVSKMKTLTTREDIKSGQKVIPLPLEDLDQADSRIAEEYF